MNFLINIFFLVFMTSLTGTFLQSVWFLGAKLCGRRNPLIVYAGLRAVCISYLVPVVYLLVWHYFDGSFFYMDEDTNYVRKELVFSERDIHILEVLGSLWLCLFFAQLAYQIVKYLRWQWFLRKKYREQAEDILEKLSECQNRLGMKKTPDLYRKAGLTTPLCTGLFCKSIQLPEKQYGSDEMNIIFMHELTHIKKHDLEMKWISVLITMIHCFNPMVYFLFRQISVWSEICCDILACEKGRETFSIKKYYSAILGMMTQQEDVGTKGVTMTALVEKDTDITRRIRFFKNYRKTKMPQRLMAGVFMAAVLFTGFVVSCASGKAALECYDSFSQKKFSMEMEIEEIIPLEETYVKNIDRKWKFSRKNTYKIDNKSSSGKMEDWNIKAGKAYQTEEFYCEQGSELKIYCIQTGNEDITMMAGMIGEDRSSRIVQDKNGLVHTFFIKEDGNYRIFVSNMNSLDIQVYLYYYK